MKRRAFVGDGHGCIDEWLEMMRLLKAEGVDEAWSTGDLVDKGPDSAAVVDYCMRNNVRAIMGNHEEGLLVRYDTWKKTGRLPKNPDRARTVTSMTPEMIAWLRTLQPLAVFDDLKLVAVHGGLIPRLPLHEQVRRSGTICRLQMCHPGMPGKSKWFEVSQDGEPEEELRKKGWARWYELHDWEYDVVFGHSVFPEPMVHQNEGAGRTIGIDTGCVYGGKLTAVIMPDLKFVSVPARKKYAERKRGE